MKSATSYLQVLCQTNRELLLDAGVWWPGTRRNFLAIHDLLGTSKGDQERPGAAAALLGKIDEFDRDVLISNELIMSRDRRRLRMLLDAFKSSEIQIAITARDLGRVVPSQWQTMIRSGGTMAWTEYIDLVCRGPEDKDPVAQGFWRRQYLPAAVSRFAELVPDQNICLVTVPPAGSAKQLIGERFFGALGIELRDVQVPDFRNVSLGVHSSELLRRLNGDVKDWSWSRYRRSFKGALSSRVLVKRTDEPRLVLSAEQLERVGKIAQQMVSELEGMNVRTVGSLTDLVPAAASKGAAPVDPGDSTAADLLAAATDGLVGMAELYANAASKKDAASDPEEDASPGRSREQS